MSDPCLCPVRFSFLYGEESSGRPDKERGVLAGPPWPTFPSSVDSLGGAGAFPGNALLSSPFHPKVGVNAFDSRRGAIVPPPRDAMCPDAFYASVRRLLGFRRTTRNDPEFLLLPPPHCLFSPRFDLTRVMARWPRLTRDRLVQPSPFSPLSASVLLSSSPFRIF